MKSGDRASGTPLDRAIDEIRQAEPDPREIEQASRRVRTQLSRQARARATEGAILPVEGALNTCADYQALLDDYRSGRLGTARSLLLEDHSRGCPECWHLMHAEPAAGAARPDAGRDARVSGRAWTIAAVAATLLLAAGAWQAGLVQQVLFPADATASVRSIRGQMMLVTGQDVEPLAAGAIVAPGQAIRTGRNSGAIVELADGSRIELAERSEVSFVPARDGIRIALDGGSVIVQAADQGAGHLYLSTGDVDVSVIGTVFSVSAGTKGSRVLVLEGEVRVEHGNVVESLHPGDQYNGSPALQPVLMQQEVAWSQNADTYLALIEQIAGMRDELQGAFTSPNLRYGSRLIDRVPGDTVLYGAFPNLTRTLVDAYDVFRRRIQENPATAAWWNESVSQPAAGSLSIEQMIEYIRTASGSFGSEIVVAFGENGATPVLLAEITNEAAVAGLMRTAAADSELRVVTSLPELQALAGSTGAVASLGDGLLVFSPDVDRVIQVVSGASTGFASSDLYPALRAAYNDGVDWLLAADVAALARDADVPAVAGLTGLQDVIVDHRTSTEPNQTRAIMRFDPSVGGIPTWIEAPGPMRALDFVSPDALAVVAGLGRDPALILSELFGDLQRQSPDAWNELVDFQQTQGIDLRSDLAVYLGGEFLVALDGALVPSPSWKVVAEVTDAAGLQQTIERIVAASSQLADPDAPAALALTAESVDGRTFYTIRPAAGGWEVHYTYADGYLVAAPARVLVTQALQYRQTRLSLAQAPAFLDQLPAGQATDCSVVLYQALGSAVSLLAVPASTVSAEQLAPLVELARDAPPTLTCVTAEAGRLVASNQGDLPFDLVTLGGLSTVLDAARQVQ